MLRLSRSLRAETHDRNCRGYWAGGLGLALRWARAGESVVVGSRDGERARAAAAQIAEKAGPLGSVEGVENSVAVKMCDTVVLTVPFAGQAELLKQLKPSFRQGTVLIDATVPLATAVGGRPTRILAVWQGSMRPSRHRRWDRQERDCRRSGFTVCRRRCWMATAMSIAMSSYAPTTSARGRWLRTWR